jgi:hypothetical protein
MDATARRRWFGAAVLLTALTMLILGDTALKGRLHGLGYLLYWLGCFALTTLAMAVAFVDARALQSRARKEQRELIERTFRIEKPKDEPKPRKNGNL